MRNIRQTEPIEQFKNTAQSNDIHFYFSEEIFFGNFFNINVILNCLYQRSVITKIIKVTRIGKWTVENMY